MSDNLPLTQWVANFRAGMYAAADLTTQCKAGWFDWFCKDKSLRGKTAALGPKVCRIAKSPKVNVETMYVFFKNNCPLYGSLYDDFRICDLESGDVIFTITPASGHSDEELKGRTEIWGRENDFDGPLYVGDWKGALKWFEV